MSNVSIQLVSQLPASRRQVEYVERKGIGHPDTICDGVMEAAAVALCRAYREVCGRILHHNLDKSLLVAGQSSPRPGGGRIDRPMRLVLGDRATSEIGGRRIDVGGIVTAAAREWLRRHLRFVDPDRHLLFQNEIQQGSAELVDIFARERLTANDTSAAVGYAPLTETERLVLEAERHLNSPEFKSRFPQVGEDVKVMAFRQGRRVALTVAAAFVDRFVSNARQYFEDKAAVRDELHRRLAAGLQSLDELDIALNTLDDPSRGEAGMYLTVLGTSAEGADGGEVGRGNRVNGVISLHRPMTLEAAAGKNPVSHVGKVYNLFSHHLAARIYETVPGVQETAVWLCSQIGRPLDDPWSVSVELIPAADACAADLEPGVREVIHTEFQELPRFIERLERGELSVM